MTRSLPARDRATRGDATARARDALDDAMENNLRARLAASIDRDRSLVDDGRDVFGARAREVVLEFARALEFDDDERVDGYR